MIQLRFDDDAASLAVRVRLQFEHIRQQQDVLQQVINALAGFSGNINHDGIAAPLFRNQLVTGSAPA